MTPDPNPNPNANPTLTTKDAAVLEVIEEYAERLKEWYKKTAADDTKEEVVLDSL